MVINPQRKIIRAQWHDYSTPGSYFITICTKDRRHYFGFIKNKTMYLSKLGEYCNTTLQQISIKRQTIIIDEFIIMPDHIHLILTINPRNPSPPSPSGFKSISLGESISCTDGSSNRPVQIPISAPTKTYTRFGNTYINGKLQYTYTGPTVGSIIKLFKGSITKYAKTNEITFQRHSRYHDIIIKNKLTYTNIKKYIQKNPEKRCERVWDGVRTV